MTLRIDLAEYQNKAKALEMSRYMKNRFPFLGIQRPQCKALTKNLLKESKNWTKQTLFQEILFYYQQDAREYQYIAIGLIEANYKRILWDEWQHFIFPLIDQKAWWDSVDALRKPISVWLKENPQMLEAVILPWMTMPSLWMRRVAITVQLQYKNQTDTTLLTKAILSNQNDDEFFIQKAIGWALREYSKTDSEWVRQFIRQHKLAKLTVREASKYL